MMWSVQRVLVLRFFKHCRGRFCQVPVLKRETECERCVGGAGSCGGGWAVSVRGRRLLRENRTWDGLTMEIDVHAVLCVYLESKCSRWMER